MKKPVAKRKRRGFAQGGLVDDGGMDVDKAADKYRALQPTWHDNLNFKRGTRDTNDAMVASGTAGTTRSRMKELDVSPQAIDRPSEIGLARGGRVKKTIPVKRKRR